MATMRREATGLATEALITTSGPGEPREREEEAYTADGEEGGEEGKRTDNKANCERGREREREGIGRQRDNIARRRRRKQRWRRRDEGENAQQIATSS